MSMTGALNSAISGLNAVTTATGLVSENIANALTPGYGTRSITLSSSTVGPGVQVHGVDRISDPVLVANRRAADATHANASVQADFWSRFESLVGQPDDPGSISAGIGRFEQSLILATSSPDQFGRLNDVVVQANLLTSALNSASEGLRDMRSAADQTIGLMVDDLNTSLSQLEELNTQIASVEIAGGNSASLQDQRQVVIDEINVLVPVTVVPREHGKVALYTDGGAILIDGPAAEIGFTAATDTMPEMTIENGALSGLTINGNPVRTDSVNGALRGGALGAQFALRDEWAPEAQANLDAVARDLIERFEDPTLDPTRAPGDPGLFTDNGTLFDPLNETGVAGRISINPVVDPAQGGESWRLRDGLGAATQGAPGDATLLLAMTEALSSPRAIASGEMGGTFVTANEASAGLFSFAAHEANIGQNAMSFSSANLTELSRIELAQGVDTDAELQSLLVLEQAYAANARVIEVVSEMMDQILRI